MKALIASDTLMLRLGAIFLIGAGMVFAGEPNLIPAPPTPRVRSVEIQGSNLKVDLATHAGDAYDPNTVSKDVRALWASGKFSDIRAEAAPQDDGTSVIFHVVEKPQLVLHYFRVEPHSFGLQVNLPEGTPIDRARAQQVAMDFRKQLFERGFADAEVEPEIIPYSGNKVDLHLRVKAGEAVRVKAVSFVGETGLDPKTVRGQLHALRVRTLVPAAPGLWSSWRLYPAYSYEAVQSDLGRLRSLYLSRGYFDAQVRLDQTDVQGKDATVRIYLNPGPRYRVRQWEVSGAGVKSILFKPANEVFRSQDLCSCLVSAQRDAEKRGIIDFNVRMTLNHVEDG